MYSFGRGSELPVLSPESWFLAYCEQVSVRMAEPRPRTPAAARALVWDVRRTVRCLAEFTVECRGASAPSIFILQATLGSPDVIAEMDQTGMLASWRNCIYDALALDPAGAVNRYLAPYGELRLNIAGWFAVYGSAKCKRHVLMGVVRRIEDADSGSGGGIAVAVSGEGESFRRITLSELDAHERARAS